MKQQQQSNLKTKSDFEAYFVPKAMEQHCKYASG